MKRARQVLQRKEGELERVNDEMEAFRVAARLLEDKGDPAPAARNRSAKILGIS
jgi:hypothetical protein